ncbi:MAG: glycosyltransferase family 4 protein [Phycisphaerales bacterium]|nr:glycosyltransferase family 4 protein [Phycisphaerales bacterium]MCB9863882.1 glycosyltransferase family 4 protein [Phycisphaerales bacterium]
MRIVHVITRLIIGGAQENTILTCEGLHAKGHDVTLITGPTLGPEGSLVPRAKSGGYRYVEADALIRAVNPLDDWRAARQLRALLHSLEPDVVHTHSSKAGILGRIAADRARVPCVVHTVHGMSFNRTQKRLTQSIYAAAERFCARKTHAIVCVADAMCEQMLAANIGSPDQYTTIRSGMETDTFDPTRYDAVAMRAEWNTPADAIVVGAVARLFRNKGYEQLIEIMDRAARKEPRMRFVWIGDGADRAEYEAELSRRNLRDRTTITGLVPPGEIPRLLSGIDILAHASQWEGLPRAVVQALLMEKPAVSFDIDGAPEVIKPDETGQLAPLNDCDAFANALTTLATDASMRKRLGRTGRQRCLIEFSKETMTNQLEALYKRLRIGASTTRPTDDNTTSPNSHK